MHCLQFRIGNTLNTPLTLPDAEEEAEKIEG